MLDGARSLIATSEQEADELASGGISRDRIFLRRNGVVVPPELPRRGAFRAKHGLPAGSKMVLFLGRLSAKKSPDLLLETFAGLGRETLESTDARLVFAGPDDEGQQAGLAQVAIRLNVSPRVIFFTGPLSETAKWEVYRDADAFVLPSQNENFGNTAAEAVAAGTPVIVTEGCGVAPLLADTAGIVVPHSAGAIAKALRSPFLTDSSQFTRKAVGRMPRKPQPVLAGTDPSTRWNPYIRRLSREAAPVQ